MAADLAWTNDDTPSDDDVAFLRDRINEYNFATTGIYDGRELATFVRDGDGRVVAGLYGWTWGGCLAIQFLWVNEELRGRGYGTRLLRAAENEAITRGCGLAVLNTHSFQAPDFYERLGYEVVSVTDGYPRQHQDIHMKKTLG